MKFHIKLLKRKRFEVQVSGLGLKLRKSHFSRISLLRQKESNFMETRLVNVTIEPDVDEQGSF